MCGIFGIIFNASCSSNQSLIDYKKYSLKCVRKIQHRGPDGTGYYQSKNVILAHTRLSIIDPKSGNQPFISKDGNVSLCVNGEIFNYKELRKEYSLYPYKTNSDCESILALYYSKLDLASNNNSSGNDSTSNNTSTYMNDILSHLQIVSLLQKLDGQFSFIINDSKNNMILIARDPFGITQLYYGMDSTGNIHIASEMKALDNCINVCVFPSGHYMYFNTSKEQVNINSILKPVSYFSETKDGEWLITENTENTENTETTKYKYEPNNLLTDEEQSILMIKIRDSFENAVIKRLMTDVPFGILLSGGLDSSLVASVAVKYIKSRPDIYGINPIIHTFSIGDKDSTDLPFARQVAEFLGTEHHEISFTVEDGLNALEDVIYHLETYDITTIRASTPHYLLAQKIQALGIKMVLSGEGSDELLGGYLYFHQAPSDEEHQLECKKRVLDLGYFDCLRADKSTMAHSVEGRYPFLDTEFINLCINVHKDVKTQKGIEKYILRKAFDIKEPSNGARLQYSDGYSWTDNIKEKPIYLPDDILWRQKEQFSDSITYRWIDTLRHNTDEEVRGNCLMAYNYRNVLYPYNTPQTTEAFYYRQIFERLFPSREKTVKCWYPNTRWKGINSSDPSGRVQACHINTTTST
jgi:asparagine synthase (glutamine-hydrolysing)